MFCKTYTCRQQKHTFKVHVSKNVYNEFPSKHMWKVFISQKVANVIRVHHSIHTLRFQFKRYYIFNATLFVWGMRIDYVSLHGKNKILLRSVTRKIFLSKNEHNTFFNNVLQTYGHRSIGIST